MFITLKRHEREKQELRGAAHWLTDAILKNSDQGLFLLDGRGRLLPQVSHALSVLFRRQDFSNLTFEKLLAPLVSAKTLTVVRNHMTGLLGAAPQEGGHTSLLNDIEVRLTKADGSSDTAHYWFDFDPVDIPTEPRAWLVRVTDVTMQVVTLRELEDLRGQLQTQGEILRGVLQGGGPRFAGFLQKTDLSMNSIATVLKKSAREEDAFRGKLEETLAEVDRIRREAAEFKLTALQSSARVFEDALHELRSRASLSGGDFLPLAVKLDHLYGQFALLKSLTQGAMPAGEPADGAVDLPRTAPAGSLESTLSALTDHIAQEFNKEVMLECRGLERVPPRYQSAVKNVAIQLIRNAVMHGIETPALRTAAGKALHGTLRLEFQRQDANYELLFEDDGCGLDPQKVRATAIERGVVSGEAAARMRDREAIKLIFKSGFTTIGSSPTDTTHGRGMSMVRRHIHEAGGKIALASLPGHETRFKISLPVAPAPAAQTPAPTAAGLELAPDDAKVA